MIHSQFPISTYIINLKNRVERKKKVLKEFADKGEFSVTVVEAIKHEIGAVSLWNTIKHILQNLINKKDEYILICEDDHQFTEKYSKDFFFNCIQDAKKLNADILLGGVSWVTSILKKTENIFWTEEFTGLQFTVIFRKFFKKIISTQFNLDDYADNKIASVTNKVFFIYPFISIQKDFGYSDVTLKNDAKGRVKELFNDSITSIKLLTTVYQHYRTIVSNNEVDIDSFDSIVLPVYVINLPERTERLKHIHEQFKERNEFNVTIMEACKHYIGTLGLWLSIRKVIAKAIENDDDVIIICEDDHVFTNFYSKEFLFTNIVEAHNQGVDYLSGGCGGFGAAIPITKNRFWVNQSLSTQFIIIYKKFYQKILDEPFDENTIADIKLSEMTSNKMILYPFISRQKDFGYSDVTPIHESSIGFVKTLFTKTENRLKTILNAYLEFTPKSAKTQ